MIFFYTSIRYHNTHMKARPTLTKLLLISAICGICIVAFYNMFGNKLGIHTNTSNDKNSPVTNTSNPQDALGSTSKIDTEINSKMKSGSLIVWGQDHDKQLGDRALPANTVDIALGTDFSLALLSDGQVMSWGSNDSGQLGRPTKNNIDDGTPTIIPGLTHITSISATNKHALALDADGSVFAWGSNFTGQIGDGTNENKFSPTKISTKKAVRIAAGYKFSMIIDVDGQVYAWGASCSTETQKKALALLNSFGSNINSIQGGYYDSSSTGEGTYDHSEDCLNETVVGIKSKIPKKIEGISQATEISAGYGHGLILKKDGTVWSFGCNSFGQLGRAQFDNAVPNAIPMQIDGIKNATAISAGFRTSFILDKKGIAYYWGINSKIDATTGSTFNFSTPFPLPPPAPGMKIQAISSGRDFSLMIADGKVYGIGNDQSSIITKVNESYIAIPTQVEKLKELHPFKIVAGGTHAGALYQIHN